jgi:hypothetical protein
MIEIWRGRREEALQRGPAQARVREAQAPHLLLDLRAHVLLLNLLLVQDFDGDLGSGGITTG